MRKDQLEHLIRAASAVLGVDEVIVVGSQAIHASLKADLLPPETTLSVEADILPVDGDEAKSDLIDGTIGEASMFHESFGVYAQGVGQSTCKLSAGWRDRLVALQGPNTSGAIGWCLELHDLVAAKLLAGRDKDVLYCRSLFSAGLVRPNVVLARVQDTPDVDEVARAKAIRIATASHQRGV